MIAALGFFWVLSAGLAVFLDQVWARKMKPYWACALMHGVIAAIIGAHLALNTQVLSTQLAPWVCIGTPFGCAFFSLICLSLSRRYCAGYTAA